MKQTLRERQQQMMEYLLDGKGDIADHIAQQGNITVDTRLHIYLNAYRVRLRETIDTDHPVTGDYLGDELFDQMVRHYTEQHPSRYKSLRHFCDELPAFLASSEPFNAHPQIAELARFERLLLSAFDAADASTLESEALASLASDAWPEMTVSFHPSVRLFESHWNVVSIWQAMKKEATPPDAKWSSEQWLLWRNRDHLTEFSHLNSAELCMYRQFLSGADFATVCEALLELIPESEVSTTAVNTLVKWIDQGLIRSLIVVGYHG